MADLQDPYARSRLILEYLRAFAWPLVVLLILVVYRQDLVQLVSEREFEAFGVRVGPRIVRRPPLAVRSGVERPPSRSPDV